MFNSARLIGPSIAGLLIAWIGEGWCFLIDAVSYLAVIASLLLMRVAPRTIAKKTGRIVTEIVEGYRYVSGFAPIRAVLLLLALVSLLGMPYIVLMPIMAGSVLHGGPHTLGFLMAASGLGALSGALYLASRRTVLGLGRVIAFAAAGFGLGLAAFSLSRSLWISMPLMTVSGLCGIVMMASSNTILQTLTDDDKRGRVMSFYSMAFFGTTPLGSLIAGSLASGIGAPETIFVGGMCVVVGALLFLRKLPALRKVVHPVYIRLGILPGPGEEGGRARTVTLPPES
jgi:MFS family permease